MQGYPPPPNQPPPPPPYGYGPPPPPGGYGAPPAAMTYPGAPFGIEPITGIPYSDKQRAVAGLLQIFLGAFGAGRFYTGHTGIAIAQIAATWFTCVGFLWPLIDGIMMMAGKVPDANGRPLRE